MAKPKNSRTGQLGNITRHSVLALGVGLALLLVGVAGYTLLKKHQNPKSK